MWISKYYILLITLLIVGCDLEDDNVPADRIRSGFVVLGFSPLTGAFNGGDTSYTLLGIITATDSTSTPVAGPRGLMFPRFIQVTDSNGVHTFYYSLPGNRRIRVTRGAGVRVAYRELATMPVQANLSLRGENGQLIAMVGNLLPVALQDEQVRAGVTEFAITRAENTTVLRTTTCGIEGDFDMEFSSTGGTIVAAPAASGVVAVDGVAYEIANVCNSYLLRGSCVGSFDEQIYLILRQ